MGGSFFKNGSLSESTATTATAAGTTTLVAADATNQQFTGVTTQTVVLPDATTLSIGRNFRVLNRSSGAVTVNFNGGSLAIVVAAGSGVEFRVISNGTSTGTWDINSGGSTYTSPLTTLGDTLTHSTVDVRHAAPADYGMMIADSGQTDGWRNVDANSMFGRFGKNYIKFADFENNSTTGWTLAHSSLTSAFPSTVGTATNSFSSAGGAHGGSAANGNLSLAVGGAAIAGLKCLQLVSSSATTAGDMVISNTFLLDAADYAKVLSFKFLYTPASGTSNANWSGTSSNSFGVAIYDVANAAWIMPAGVWNLVQGSGVGICQGNFQVPSNASSLQIAVFNANATSGAITLDLDEFYVGPQTMAFGPPVTDWATQTTTGSWVSNTTYVGYYRRVGGNLEADISITLQGLPTAGALTVNLPSGLVIDTVKIGETARAVFGKGYCSQAVVANIEVAVQYNTTTSIAPITWQTNALGGGANPQYIGGANSLSNAAQGNWANGNIIHFKYTVPIVGWSSNTVMSSDTDTRVAAMQVSQAVPTATITGSSSLVKFTSAPAQDTHGGFNTTTGAYTVSVTGHYRCTFSLGITATYANTNNAEVYIAKNGTPIPGGIQVAGAAEGTLYPCVTATVFCNAGDTLSPFAACGGTSPSVHSNANLNFFHVERLTGPATISASESVGMHYYNSAAQSFTTGVTADCVYDTKILDTHNSMNGATGVYTFPASGLYMACATFNISSTSLTANTGFLDGIIAPPGIVAVKIGQIAFAQTGQAYSITGSVVFRALAGQTMKCQFLQTNGGARSSEINTQSFSLARIGI